jgi:hypothetical protein
MDYILRFEVAESSCGSGWMVFDNVIMYCAAGPMREEEACRLAAAWNRGDFLYGED